MSNLPPLTKKIAPGAAGGNEFERLMNQLLLHHADGSHDEYVPVGGRGPDGGVDGLAPHGCAPAFTGPVSFAGPMGALMLAQASFAALMTGLPCDGDIWKKLVAELSKGLAP